MQREDAVLVAGELGELPDVVPHPLVGRVKQVGTVLVHLDTGLRLELGVGVTADMRALFDDEDPLAELGSHALGNRQTEKTGADDEKVEARCHRLPRVSDRAAVTPLAALRSSARLAAAKVAITSQFDITTLVTIVASVPSTP
jgi:hypothetical protein